MHYTYTAVITPGEGKYYACVPDIPGCITTGRDIEDAVSQITDALSGCLVVWEDQNLPIPSATPQPGVSHGQDDILIWSALIRLPTGQRPTPARCERMYPSPHGWPLWLSGRGSTVPKSYRTPSSSSSPDNPPRKPGAGSFFLFPRRKSAACPLRDIRNYKPCSRRKEVKPQQGIPHVGAHQQPGMIGAAHLVLRDAVPHIPLCCHIVFHAIRRLSRSASIPDTTSCTRCAKSSPNSCNDATVSGVAFP